MKVKTLAAAIITLGLAFAIPQTYASHSDGTNTSDLVHKADLIFEGKVVEVDYRTSDILQADDVAMPHTYVTYEITRNFKGSSSQDKLITLRFRGGPDDAGNTLIIRAYRYSSRRSGYRVRARQWCGNFTGGWR